MCRCADRKGNEKLTTNTALSMHVHSCRTNVVGGTNKPERLQQPSCGVDVTCLTPWRPYDPDCGASCPAKHGCVDTPQPTHRRCPSPLLLCPLNSPRRALRRTGNSRLMSRVLGRRARIRNLTLLTTRGASRFTVGHSVVLLNPDGAMTPRSHDDDWTRNRS